jgi:hypothetical protein
VIFGVNDTTSTTLYINTTSNRTVTLPDSTGDADIVLAQNGVITGYSIEEANHAILADKADKVFVSQLPGSTELEASFYLVIH